MHTNANTWTGLLLMPALMAAVGCADFEERDDSKVPTLVSTETGPVDSLVPSGMDSLLTADAAEPTLVMDGPDTERNYADQVTEFTGTITGEGDLSLTFASSEDGVEVFDVEVAPDGSFVASAVLSDGDHVITALVESDNGGSAFESAKIYVGGPNVVPNCEVVTPVAGEPVAEGELSSMSAWIHDKDQSSDTLRVIWSSDIDGYLGEGQLNPDTGMVQMDTWLSSGTHEVTVTVFDEVGEGCSDSVTHIVENPVDMVVTGPEVVVEEGDLVKLGVVADGARGSRVVWSANGQPLGTSRINDAGTSDFVTDALPAGMVVVVAETTDEYGWEISAEVAVMVSPVGE